MKVLFVCHISEYPSGWGRAAYETIKAMETVGIDVVVRNFQLSKNNIPEDILPLTKKSKDGCTVCIQHLLPHFLCYDGNYKCIALTDLETYNLKHMSWHSRLELMDEVWIPASDMLSEFTRARWIPHPIDIEEYKPETVNNDTYKFYFIGEMSKRKNLISLIRAFHLEFQNEPVDLVLKLNKPGLSPEDTLQLAEENIGKVKEGMKFPTKKELIITSEMSREEILQLHNSCNCYVNTSYGECFSYPICDAIGMGNTVVSNACGGPMDLLQDYDNYLLVNNHKEPCFGAVDTFKDLYTGREHWYSINILDLCRKMRLAYQLNKKSTSSRFSLRRFTYQSVGERILKALSE